MKKQTILTFLAISSLLTACPSDSNGDNPSGTPSAQTASAEATPLTLGTQPAPAAGLKPLTAFPKEHLSCCWDELQKADAQYAKLALDAANDKSEALEKLLTLSSQLPLTTSYAHGAVLAEILHRIGDARFAWVLQKLDVAGELKKAHPDPNNKETLRDTLRVLLEGGFSLNQAPEVHKGRLVGFPETSKSLQYQVEGQSI